FIDIGLKDSGLVHISQMANRYVKSPYEVVAVGDVVAVWVMSVDQERRRVSLTMIKPGTERKPPEKQAPAPRPQSQQQRSDDRPPPRGGSRPPRSGRPAGKGRAPAEKAPAAVASPPAAASGSTAAPPPPRQSGHQRQAPPPQQQRPRKPHRAAPLPKL